MRTKMNFIVKPEVVGIPVPRYECPSCGSVFGFLTEDLNPKTVPAYCPECGYDTDETIEVVTDISKA